MRRIAQDGPRSSTHSRRCISRTENASSKYLPTETRDLYSRLLFGDDRLVAAPIAFVKRAIGEGRAFVPTISRRHSARSTGAQDLPNTTNPDDGCEDSGKGRAHVTSDAALEGRRPRRPGDQRVATGQYL